MRLSPFPVSFKVFSKKACYKCFKRDIPTFGYAFEYQINIEAELKPWVTVNIHDFYLELHTNEGLLKAKPMWEIEDTRYSIGRNISRIPKLSRMGRGFKLEPYNPIFKVLTFQYTGERIVNIHPRNFIVLEVGIRKGRWAIRKPIILEAKNTEEAE